MIAENDEGQRLLPGNVKPDEIGKTDRCEAARGDDAIDGVAAKTGYAQQFLAAGAGDIERETVAMAQRPGEFRIDVERQHAGVSNDFVDAETVEAQQPVGLVKPVLADQGRGGERERVA